MEQHDAQQLVNDVIGNAHLFVAAVTGMKNALLGEIAGRQLSFSQLKVLKLIDVTEAHHVGDVAAFLGVSDAAASKTVDRLVQQNYIRRTVVRSDRRSAELSLAPAGRKLLNRYEAAKDRRLAAMFSDLDTKDLRRTSEFLERLTKVIVNSSANPEEICLQCGIYLKKRCLVREAVRADCFYQKRRTTRQVRRNATEAEVPTRGGARMGPPG